MSTVLNCIERIPGKLAELAGQADERFAGLGEMVKGRSIHSLYFVASGSSYNAAFAAKQFLEMECNLRVRIVYPNVFLNYEKIWDREALYVFLSQGGATKTVFLSAEKAREAGCLTCAVTSNPASPIGNACDASLDMGCGEEEFLYRTLGYSMAAATVCFLGLAVRGMGDKRAADYREDLKNAAANLPFIEKETDVWYEKNRFSILRRNKAMLAGPGQLWPVAQEADIKLMEMVPMMTRSYELEEFIHGPQNCFGDDMIFFILSKNGEDREKAVAIARFLKEKIGFCAMVGDVTMEPRDLPVKPASRYFWFLEYITVFQVLAYRMAVDRGRDLSRGVNAGIGAYISKTL